MNYVLMLSSLWTFYWKKDKTVSGSDIHFDYCRQSNCCFRRNNSRWWFRADRIVRCNRWWSYMQVCNVPLKDIQHWKLTQKVLKIFVWWLSIPEVDSIYLRRKTENFFRSQMRTFVLWLLSNRLQTDWRKSTRPSLPFDRSFLQGFHWVIYGIVVLLLV